MEDSDALLLSGAAPGLAEDLGDWLVHEPGPDGDAGWILRFPRPDEFYGWDPEDDELSDDLTHVEVTVEHLDAVPVGEPGARFSRAAEVSCLESANLEGSGGGLDTTPSEPGTYRVRLLMDESRLPTRLWVQSWPASAQPGRLLRGPAVREDEPLPPHPDLQLAEIPAGIAAAARIGNDVDGGPAARSLSGRLGVARAQITLPHGPAWHSDFFDQVYVLTPNSDYSIPDYVTHPLPVTAKDWWTVCVMSHEKQDDRLMGWLGAIWSQPHPDDDPPRRRAHWWRWVRRVPPGPHAVRGGTMLEPVLPQDTVRVVHLVRLPGKPVHTEIVIEHRDVPVEWVDDLNAWWRMQLAIHATRV